MVLITPLLTILALAMGPAIAAPDQSLDWKYLHGWDGVVSSPTSIGLPLRGSKRGLNSRAENTVGGIFLCDGGGFTGTCGFAVQPLNTCIVLGDDWNNKIASLGPDPGTIVVAYNASDCTGPATAFAFPGSGDLSCGGWTDNISSFKPLAG